MKVRLPGFGAGQQRQGDLSGRKGAATILAGERDGVRVEVEQGPVRPLFTPHPATMALYTRARAIANATGFDVDHGQFGGGSDGNTTSALGTPTLDGLGPMGEGAHAASEQVIISSIPARAALLDGILREWKF